MNPISIPRGNMDDNDPRPCWIPLVTGDPLRQCKPAIRCQCGEVTLIGLHHVHADGRVTASFIHDRPKPEACGWHVYLFLDGYAEEVGIDFPPEKD